MGREVACEEVIKTIAKNYEEIENSIVNQLNLNVPNHDPTTGSYRENVWKSLFEMIIPRKYCIEQGVFIIDSDGNKSREVDLVIFDELYTPYIFHYGEIKFIPIEAVSAVVQCKSSGLKARVIAEWVESIDALVTSMDSVARMTSAMVDNKINGGHKVTQTATRPIKILCSLAKKVTLCKYKDEFDILLTADKKNKKLIKVIKGEMESLVYWNDSLNHAIEDRREIERDMIRV